MFRDCPRCEGGWVTWSRPEPEFERELGYIGICAQCGRQWSTNDLLGIRPGEKTKRAQEPHRYGDRRIA